ncbi:MAG: hypothetical protein A2487_11715 [Candidatus Raymondbacteria bacterium RifOxyC12_full_50_8]|uniref:Uncharacterized protein n=1 Tax=Candidatus Raymondbacteria bacterium RIFOXYD12_FULL_49_13 TaxID=1817890 RepID=A0A1F7F7U1_UNCRA|nr:MAG: hypothetical protein A2248_13705 [Candidatus Raymondbacteria bacterium RIFOXYA2_FULL_49_16]OGJ95180.1 MAG: hypothetical protein A2350_09560 [Candidatus Raymondbacteria bacterium RifOxyB12_full_50_8]OGK01938.1 MAG: hypothetical protein A2487_11715 [Candidatus Raymondbacteria bacterium RifOxyC12_full_50_8]OGK02693.1 MAG: hypothetical protein A2519_09515 [Candidatus Raymondbacteria bacterium RIFOXYD12_FULL_49_13]OGP42338.1 MAG: hypothetical protein A2324_20190 [Candidatus Raymondbacteria b
MPRNRFVILSVVEINWERLYGMFTAPVIEGDCSVLCAHENRGVPPCCSIRRHVPMLFKEEFAWLMKKTRMWSPKRALFSNHHAIMFCACKGVRECDRHYRSLSCRFFPFEPYMDDRGRFLGATWMYSVEKTCPLVGSAPEKVNQAFIDQFVRVWTKLFLVYHEEYEFYRAESRKLREAFARIDRNVQVFTPSLSRAR